MGLSSLLPGFLLRYSQKEAPVHDSVKPKSKGFFSKLSQIFSYAKPTAQPTGPDMSRRKFLVGLATVTAGLMIAPEAVLANGESFEAYRKRLFQGNLLESSLISKLTPEYHQKNQSAFEEVFLEFRDFLRDEKASQLYQQNNAQTQYEQDKKLTLDTLMQNLSLGSDYGTSEDVRDLLKKEGVLDFEAKIQHYINKIEEYQKKIPEIQKTLESDVSQGRKDQAQQRIYLYENSISALQDHIQLAQKAMFWFRWHEPSEIKKTVDFKQAEKAYSEALDSLTNLEEALVGKNYLAAEQSLKSYKEKFTLGMNLFSDDLDTLLQQAQVQIGQNMIGQPLTQITYQNQVYTATKEFAQDWKKVREMLEGKIPESGQGAKEFFLFIGYNSLTKKTGLYKLSFDGKELTNLLETGPDSFSFDFDAKRNLIVAEQNGKLISMNLDGGDKKIILCHPDARHPQITEEGIFFHNPALTHYYQMDFDGSDLKPVYGFPKFDLKKYEYALHYALGKDRRSVDMSAWDIPPPRISPDGRTLAYVEPFEEVKMESGKYFKGTGSKLHLVDLKTRSEKVVPSGIGNLKNNTQEIIWSDDSRRLVFTDTLYDTNGSYQKLPPQVRLPQGDFVQDKIIGEWGSGRAILLVDCSQSKPTVQKVKVSQTWGGYFSPVFFPDGRKIVYLHNVGSRKEPLHLMTYDLQTKEEKETSLGPITSLTTPHPVMR
ncbi:TolB family protein [Nanoarchaeota archaeon]